MSQSINQHRSRQSGLALLLLLCLQPAFPQTPPQTPVPDKALIPEKKDQLAEDSARLLQLATELKAEVDKSTKDQLSIAVVKKAEEVEKLARKVREEMKASPASVSR